ncbi:MAG: RNA polymerase sigma factor RpoH [Gammaproteobacteria bacterium]|nr:RNA polymerase sigma factor RpoH [Gammaproteobacteria bacterium]NNC98444.1 RNA polymerase sigma factor RpoH [Gammaproteobacteria bacterium]NNM14751.1 RNA polymerase sigma factor RpoH [Gammaproteobacteria bacterium]
MTTNTTSEKLNLPSLQHNFELMLAGGSASLDAYMQTVSTIPVLSKQDEVALAERLRDHGDINAARDLILPHLRFVVHIAKGYRGYGLQLGDLIQEGNVGLMKAVKRFDPTYGVRLVSFAVHWIRAEIHEYVIRNWRVVKIATTKAQRKLFFNLRKMRKNMAWLSHDESLAIAKDLGVKVETVREMEKRLTGSDIGFDLRDSDDDEKAFAPVAYLEKQDADPAQLLEAEDYEDHNTQQLSAALGELDERSRDILKQRWLSDKKSTLHELADKYGISAERIRQLEANALKKLRKFIDV